MTKTVNTYEAKTHFSQLLDKAAAGEAVTIARNGKPVADLVAHQPKKKIKLGTLKGKIHYDDEHFDDPDEEMIKLMTESPIFPDEPDDSAR